MGGPASSAADPYNAGQVGRDRRVTWTRASLDDVKAIKNSAGGTINDVVLSIVTLALRRHLSTSRSLLTRRRRPRPSPWSTRRPDPFGSGHRTMAPRAG